MSTIKFLVPFVLGLAVVLSGNSFYNQLKTTELAINLGAGSGTIGQLQQWLVSAGVVRLASTTADIRVPSLQDCDTIDTDGNGVFECGTDGGGGAGGGLATTSIDTEAELESILTDVTDVFTNNDGALDDDDLSDNNTSQLSESGNLYYTLARVQSALIGGYNAIFGNSTTTNATTTNLAVTTKLNLFGTVGTALSDFCVSITGGSGLCDGTDAEGSGGGLATSTAIADTQVIYGTSASDVGAEAAFTYDDATNKLTFGYGSSTAFTATSLYGTNAVLSGNFQIGGTAPVDAFQKLRITAAGSVSASDSTGGLLRLTNTLNAGSALGIYTNHAGSATNDLLMIQSDNTAYNRRAFRIKQDGTGGAGLFDCLTVAGVNECLNITSTDLLTTTLGVSGKATGHGIIKVTANDDDGIAGNASNAGASLISGVLNDAAQGIYMTANSGVGSSTGKFLQFRNFDNQYVFDTHHDGRIGIWESGGTADAMLDINATSTYDYLHLGGGSVFSVLSNGNVGIGTSSPSSLLTVGATTGSQFLVSSGGVVTDGTWNGDAIGIGYGGLNASFTDPNADQLMFWDDSAAAITGISSLAGAAISDTTLTINDVTCTGCLGSTEIAGLDMSADTNITAGRSLTMSGDSVVADAELYTDTVCKWIENPTDVDDLKSLWANKTANAWTITEIWAESDQTVAFDLQVDDGTPADVNGTDITPTAGEAEDTTLSGDTTLAAGEELDLVITSVTNTPTWVSICITRTIND